MSSSSTACGGAGRRREVHRAQLQHGVLARVHVELPSLARNLSDAAEDHVAGLGDVSAAQRADGDELVDALDRAADGGEESAVHHLRA